MPAISDVPLDRGSLRTPLDRGSLTTPALELMLCTHARKGEALIAHISPACLVVAAGDSGQHMSGNARQPRGGQRDHGGLGILMLLGLCTQQSVTARLPVPMVALSLFADT